MRNFRLFLAISSCLLISACSAIPQGKKSDLGGRYMKMIVGDFTVIQIDYPTAGVCSTQLQATKWVSQADLVCDSVSVAGDLPFVGKMKWGNLGIDPDGHFRTEQLCLDVKGAFDREGMVSLDCLGRK